MCQESFTNIVYKRVFDVFVFMMLYMVPISFMTYAYVTISRTLRYGDSHPHFCDTPCQAMEQEKVQIKRRKLVKMIMAISVTFAVTWRPYHVVTLWPDFNREGVDYQGNEALITLQVYPVVQWLALSNSSVNPLCYCLFSHKFRTALRVLCTSETSLRGRLDSVQSRETWTTNASQRRSLKKSVKNTRSVTSDDVKVKNAPSLNSAGKISTTQTFQLNCESEL